MENKCYRLITRIGCLLICLLLLSTGITVNAHEMSPRAYPADLRYSQYMRHTVAYITYNMSAVKNTNYRTNLVNAIGDWEWADDGYVSLNEVSAPYFSYIDFSDTWMSGFPERVFGLTAVQPSRTTIYGWLPNGSTLSGPPLAVRNVDKIVKCNIYVNRYYCDINGFTYHDRQHNWAHEIGHALGLNETNDGTISVMKQGKGSLFGWNDYWKPQDHDRSDLRRFNYYSWSSTTVTYC